MLFFVMLAFLLFKACLFFQKVRQVIVKISVIPAGNCGCSFGTYFLYLHGEVVVIVIISQQRNISSQWTLLV